MGGRGLMAQPDQVSDGINTEQASAARIYDYLLGGSRNFAVDREVAHQAMALVPDLPLHAQANRAFLHRAVQYLIGAGVRQFLDIGSGVPTLGNVHEVAQKADPHSRVVYVDMDPVAVAHSQAILAGNDRAGILQEDMRQPERLLAHPRLRALIDLDRPVAVLMVAILHAVPDSDDPWRIVRVLRDALPSGSYLVVAHGTSERMHEQIARMVELSARTTTP